MGDLPFNKARSVNVPTVGAKSITCAKSITRYDINGHNISKFFKFYNFFFLLFPTECKNNNIKMKIGNFFENMLWPTQKFFFATIFFRRRFFHHCSTFRVANLLLKRAYIPKTTSPFLGGVMGNFFEDNFVLSVKISPRYVHPAPKVSPAPKV